MGASSDAFRELLHMIESAATTEEIAKMFHPEVAWTADILPDGASNSSGAVVAFLDLLRTGFGRFTLRLDDQEVGQPGQPGHRGQSLPALVESKDDTNQVSFRLRFHGTNSGYLPNAGVTGREVTLTAHGTARLDSARRVTAISTSWNCARALAQLGIRAHMRPDPID